MKQFPFAVAVRTVAVLAASSVVTLA